MSVRHVVITGASGFVGWRVAKHLARRRRVTTISRSRPSGLETPWIEADLAADGDLADALERVQPDCVVHCAAMARLGDCHHDPQLAMRVNCDAAGELAAWCASRGVRLFHVSTDQVFDGRTGWYCEDDAPQPVNVYGETKARSEEAVHAAYPEATCLRLALVFGRSASGQDSSSEQIVSQLAAGEHPGLYVNEFRSPIDVGDVCGVIESLCESASPPLLHVAGPERLSRHDFGAVVAQRAGVDPGLLRAVRYEPVRGAPIRPADVSLNTALLRSLNVPRPRSPGEAVEPR